MKFTIEGKAFQQQLQAVAKVMNAKNTVNILDNFLLRVEGDRLWITGSDSENMLTAMVHISDKDGDGEIAVPAKRLLDITKEVANQPISFYINDETKEIDLKFLNGHFNFMGVDAAAYPRRRALEGEIHEMTLPVSMVSKGIERTAYAVSPEVSRPIMTGIFWDIKEDRIVFVSSDTHKLVKYSNFEKGPGFESRFVLPGKTANILRNLVGKDDAEIKIVYDVKGGVFEFGDYLLSSIFVQGNYPNYDRVIPQDSPFSLVVDRASLINALRRVTLFASKASNLVVLKLESDGMLLTGQDLDYGTKAEERVMCEYSGNEMTLGFNGVFMIEILNNTAADTVQLHLSDPARPCVYTPVERQEGEDLVTIQMPMQVL